MARIVDLVVWGVTTLQLVTVIVLIWAMAAEGAALLDCLREFVG